MKQLNKFILEKLKINSKSKIIQGIHFLSPEEIKNMINDMEDKNKSIKFILFNHYDAYPTHSNFGDGYLNTKKRNDKNWLIEISGKITDNYTANLIFGHDINFDNRIEKIENIYVYCTGKLSSKDGNGKTIGYYNADNKKYKIYDIKETKYYIIIYLAENEKDLLKL